MSAYSANSLSEHIEGNFPTISSFSEFMHGQSELPLHEVIRFEDFPGFTGMDLQPVFEQWLCVGGKIADRDFGTYYCLVYQNAVQGEELRKLALDTRVAPSRYLNMSVILRSDPSATHPYGDESSLQFGDFKKEYIPRSAAMF